MATVEKRRQSTDLSNLIEPELSPQDWQDFERGIVLFNSGKYWESHEAWEEVWKRHPENSRIFFQGLIQVAAALHQLQRQIYHGAEKHFRNALWKLRPFQPGILGIDVTHLVSSVVKCREEFANKKLEQFNQRLIPRIKKTVTISRKLCSDIMKLQVIFLSFAFCVALNCAGSKHPVQRMGLSLLADEVKSELRKVEKSVVGVNTEAIYEIQKFHYATRDGEMIPDPTSPFKYQLASSEGSGGITTKDDPRTLSGGGLIMSVDRKDKLYEYTVLTSNHLVSPEDTSNVYYTDEDGAATDILFSRFVLKSLRVAVRSGNTWSSEADLVANSPADDLAIIKVKTRHSIGPEFENKIGYALDLDWGDWVFLFGYPKGIKQMTGGWVSKSPYPRTLAVDAVVRFGYSGGPVFSLNSDNRLAFVGLIKSVPRTTLNYVGFDNTVPVGASFEEENLSKLSAKQEIFVNYGTAYFVNIAAIEAFINSSRDALDDAGIVLPRKFFGN